MWLAADFQRERARHATNAKKLVRAVETHVKNREIRELRRTKVSGQRIITLLRSHADYL